MEIKKWLLSGCDYKTGVELYSKLPNNKKLLRFFKLKETSYSLQKLKYELQKYIDHPAEKKVKEEKNNRKIPILQRDKQENTFSKKEIPEAYKRKPIAYYPLVLHSTYRTGVEMFYQACSLKIKLNLLAPSESKESLKIQFEIFKCFEINDKCLKILKHYEETKRILPFENIKDFSHLNAQQLVNERQKLYSRVSKRKKTILELEEKYNLTEDKILQKKMFNKINNKKEELQKLNLEIDALSKKINQ